MTIISWCWRRLGRMRWPILWLLQPKYVIGVNGIILNEVGHIWLQRHRFWQHQAWGLPGGMLGDGENPVSGLKREITEETGRMIDHCQLVATERFFRRGLALFYLAEFLPGQTVLDRTEILEAAFFDLTALPQPMLPQHQELLKSLTDDNLI